jgi:hypothetical protein
VKQAFLRFKHTYSFSARILPTPFTRDEEIGAAENALMPVGMEEATATSKVVFHVYTLVE